MAKKSKPKCDPQEANPDIPHSLEGRILLLYEGLCAMDEKSRNRKRNVLANKGKVHCCGGILSKNDGKD